jgi:hypothetical protein
MMKQIVSSASLALCIALPATAMAQGGSDAGSCPPGSWFCAPDGQQQPAPAGKPVGGLQPLPDPDSAPATPPRSGTITYEPAPGAAAPPVVVYQPPPPVVVVRPPAEPPPGCESAPPCAHHYRAEWGLNMRVEGAAIGHGSGDAGMGGAGLALRFRPVPRFALEGDVDLVGGHDWNGDSRTELGGSVNGLLFLNPRSRAQIYLLAGLGATTAHVHADDYHYFGVQGGVGLELRLSHSFALMADMRGFIRGRTDSLAASQPEFTASDGRTTNASGGLLFTGGLTIYF